MVESLGYYRAYPKEIDDLIEANGADEGSVLERLPLARRRFPVRIPVRLCLR
jgi:hypothetical protein